MAEMAAIKKLLAKNVEESTEDDGAPILTDPELPIEEKYKLVMAALPVKSNEAFKSILADKDGSRCLMWALTLALNKSVQEEGATFDTSAKGSVLASKVLHVLFSVNDYVQKLKVFDPRENYTQLEGTAMDKDVYEWLMDAMNTIAAEFYANFQLESNFEWAEFYKKFRQVWIWTRSNNAESRRNRRRQKKKN